MQQSARPVSAKEIYQTQSYLGHNFQMGKRCLPVRFRHALKASFELGQVRRFTKIYPGSRAKAERDREEIALSSSPEVQARPRFSAPLPGAQDIAMPDAESATVRTRCQGGRSDPPSCLLRSPSVTVSRNRKNWIFIIDSNTKQSGLKLWIGELGCNVQRFPQCLFGRLIGSGRLHSACARVAKRRARSALTSRLKVSKPAPCCFGCFLEAASPDRGIGQLVKASPDHLCDHRD